MEAELPDLLLPDAPAWRRWLEENHAVLPGVWLVAYDGQEISGDSC